MKEYVIDNKTTGKKLFNFIKAILPGLKNTEIFKLIRKKIIIVNDKKADPDYKLILNDKIKIFLKNEHFKKKGNKKKFQSINKKLNIIYEDNNLLVVCKPPGILTHPDKNEYKNNLYEMTRSYLYSKNEYRPDDIFSPTPCHRIDKFTSGIVIIAKNFLTLKKITRMFRDREVIKKYYTFVAGKITKEFLIISNINTKIKKVLVNNLKILENIPDKNTFINNNKEISATLIKPILINENYTFLDINLWTGKKHQIRAHLLEIGNPVLGDNKYYTKQSLELNLRLNLKNYLLHSYSMKINNYPEWKAEMPGEFKVIKKNLFS